MRAGLLGGRIGAAYPPSVYNASGIWTLSDVYLAYRSAFGGYEGDWQKNTLTVGWPNSGWPSYSEMNWADATGTGTATFSPDITSTYPSVSYSWERSVNGGATWEAVSGETSNTLALSGVTIADNGKLFRVVVNAGLKVVRSSDATLRYDTVTVSFQYHPTSMTSNTYTYFDCSAVATGVTYGSTYEPSYQWQQSTNNGSTWSDLSGQTSSTLSIPVTPEMDLYKYRCKATFDGQTATSNAATLIYGEGGW